MGVSPDRVAARWRGRAEGERARARTRADALRARLPAAAARLRAAGADRVWLFGSLAGGHPHAETDVDLAVEGLPSSEYFGALAALMDILDAPVDLVRLEDAPESLDERVRATGEAL
jgi:predicted nucleotidyltransferase